MAGSRLGKLTVQNLAAKRCIGRRRPCCSSFSEVALYLKIIWRVPSSLSLSNPYLRYFSFTASRAISSTDRRRLSLCRAASSGPVFDVVAPLPGPVIRYRSDPARPGSHTSSTTPAPTALSYLPYSALKMATPQSQSVLAARALGPSLFLLSGPLPVSCSCWPFRGQSRRAAPGVIVEWERRCIVHFWYPCLHFIIFR